jgi:hypothetical protein
MLTQGDSGGVEVFKDLAVTTTAYLACVFAVLFVCAGFYYLMKGLKNLDNIEKEPDDEQT